MGVINLSLGHAHALQHAALSQSCATRVGLQAPGDAKSL